MRGERLNQRRLVDDAAAGEVDEIGRGLHARERGSVDQLFGVGGQGAGQRDKIGLRQHRAKRAHRLHLIGIAAPRRIAPEADDAHIESLGEARDNQHRRHWRQMIGDLAQREDELGGKTLLVVGLGDIGGRLARLAKAFDMRVIGLRRDPARGGDADEVQPMSALNALLPDADFVALTCPLTPDTEKLIDAAALARVKPPAYLVNLARGRVVDEPALIETLAAHRIAGAALDVTVEEPLPPNSPLWDMEHVLLTPHTAGETRRYEDNVIEILRDNLDRLWRGEASLRNQVV